jgi:hypothetical protein
MLDPLRKLQKPRPERNGRYNAALYTEVTSFLNLELSFAVKVKGKRLLILLYIFFFLF